MRFNAIRLFIFLSKMALDENYATVEVGSADLFNYPFLHMTGHGNVVFSDLEAQNLRQYLSKTSVMISRNGVHRLLRPPELYVNNCPATTNA